MKEGPLAAMDAIERATGEMKVHTMGYCVGGTLLATTLAWLAEKRRVRVTSATFLAAQVDFTHAGDLLVFRRRRPDFGAGARHAGIPACSKAPGWRWPSTCCARTT